MPRILRTLCKRLACLYKEVVWEVLLMARMYQLALVRLT